MLSYTLIALDLGTVLSARATQTTLLDSVKPLLNTANTHRLATRSLSA
jgi:hypothetical protein